MLVACGGGGSQADPTANTSTGAADTGVSATSTGSSSEAPGDSGTNDTSTTDSTSTTSGTSEATGSTSADTENGEDSGETGRVTCECEDTPALWGRVGVPPDIVRVDPDTGTILASFEGPQNGIGLRYRRAPSGTALVASTQSGTGPASIFKIYEDSDDCDPNRNGTPGLQTSTDSQALPSSEDDCIAWTLSDNTEGIEYETLSVTAGTYNEKTCRWEDESVWAAGCNQGEDALLEVFRYSMDSGTLLDQFEVPIDCETHTNQVLNYRAGSDPAGNYWLYWAGFSATARFVRVDGASLEAETIELPPSCPSVNRFTFDGDANLWATCYPSISVDLARYDAAAETWEVWEPDPGVRTLGGGVQVDRSGRLWYEALGGDRTINFLRTDDLTFGPHYDEMCSSCGPIASLWDGTVAFNADDTLIRLDPDTGDTEVLAGDIVSPVGWDTRQLGCRD